MKILLILLSLSFTLPALAKTEKQKQTYAAADKILRALDLYAHDCGRYPEVEQGLDALREPSKQAPLCRRWGPRPYLDVIPLDAWGRPFNYLQGCIVQSMGADFKEGGTGEDADLLFRCRPIPVVAPKR